MSADGYDTGAADAIEYVAGFLEGAATGARVFQLPAIADAFTGAANEVRSITPSMVHAAATKRRGRG